MIITICGSLRLNSLNKILLEEISKLAPHEAISSYNNLSDIPAFNPDLAEQPETLPSEVLELYSQIEGAEGLILSCPEYASEIPGAVKNLFDWLVSTTLLEGLPLMIITVSSSGSGKVQAALTTVLQMVDAEVYSGPDFLSGYLNQVKTSKGFAPEVSDQLRIAIQSFGEAVITNRIHAMGYCA